MAAGIGILALRNKAPGVWSRMAGDALDIATLVSIAVGNPEKKRRVGIACAAVLGATTADIACAALRRSQPKRLQPRWRGRVPAFGLPMPGILIIDLVDGRAAP